MNQALHSNDQGIGEESGRVNELVENYMKKNTELYDIETLIPVRNPLHGCYKIFSLLCRFSAPKKQGRGGKRALTK